MVKFSFEQQRECVDSLIKNLYWNQKKKNSKISLNFSRFYFTGSQAIDHVVTKSGHTRLVALQILEQSRKSGFIISTKTPNQKFKDSNETYFNVTPKDLVDILEDFEQEMLTTKSTEITKKYGELLKRYKYLSKIIKALFQNQNTNISPSSSLRLTSVSLVNSDENLEQLRSNSDFYEKAKMRKNQTMTIKLNKSVDGVEFSKMRSSLSSSQSTMSTSHSPTPSPLNISPIASPRYLLERSHSHNSRKSFERKNSDSGDLNVLPSRRSGELDRKSSQLLTPNSNQNTTTTTITATPTTENNKNINNNSKTSAPKSKYLSVGNKGSDEEDIESGSSEEMYDF